MDNPKDPTKILNSHSDIWWFVLLQLLYPVTLLEMFIYKDEIHPIPTYNETFTILVRQIKWKSIFYFLIHINIWGERKVMHDEIGHKIQDIDFDKWNVVVERRLDTVFYPKKKKKRLDAVCIHTHVLDSSACKLMQKG